MGNYADKIHVRSQTSEMFIPARQFLVLRALGAPAYVVSLALQGIFRGFKDTKTPVYCLGLHSLSPAIFLISIGSLISITQVLVIFWLCFCSLCLSTSSGWV